MLVRQAFEYVVQVENMVCGEISFNIESIEIRAYGGLLPDSSPRDTHAAVPGFGGNSQEIEMLTMAAERLV